MVPGFPLRLRDFHVTGTFWHDKHWASNRLSDKKARKISRILKTELPGNIVHGVIRKQQQPLGFSQLPVENQPFWRTVGKATADVRES